MKYQLLSQVIHYYPVSDLLGSIRIKAFALLESSWLSRGDRGFTFFADEHWGSLSTIGNSGCLGESDFVLECWFPRNLRFLGLLLALLAFFSFPIVTFARKLHLMVAGFTRNHRKHKNCWWNLNFQLQLTLLWEVVGFKLVNSEWSPLAISFLWCFGLLFIRILWSFYNILVQPGYGNHV